MAPAPTVAAALRAASARLTASDSARLDAELLLANCLGVSRSELYAWPERTLDAALLARFDALLGERAQAVPIAYLTGEIEFHALRLSVTRAVLVPRPETELLVDCVLARVPAEAAATVLDVGTGSGAIAAAIAHQRPRCRVAASDRSAAAVAVALANMRRLGLDRVACFCGDWLAAVAAASCDVIVANPPYVAEHEAVDAAVHHEPRAAVFAGAAGFDALAAIIAQAPRCLRAHGLLALEHGHRHSVAVRERMAAAGFAAIGSERDLAGIERVTVGRWQTAAR